ncbi:MAG: S8 family peptidase [Patescibacteria group bacterium]
MKKNKMKFMVFASSFLGIIALTALGAVQTASAKVPDDRLDKIPGQYIVVFKDKVADADSEADKISKTRKLERIHTYNRAIKGFAARMNDAELEKIKNDPRVDFVTEDRAVYISYSVLEDEYSSEKMSVSGKSSAKAQPQQTVPTGIDRVNAENLFNKGVGVGIAVIDTGIELSHPDLKTNIIANKNCLSSVKNGNDDNGHGTHAAGTIAALNNGIGVVGAAPEAKLVAVKVLNRNGSGTWSSVICGIDWMTANASKYNIKVANMSLGGAGTNDNNCGYSNNDPLHKAICKSRDAGIIYVVAAGNENKSVSLSVPAAYDDAVITVSALADSDGASGGLGSPTPYGTDDTFAIFSNYGSAVDLGAPGVDIYSTYKGGSYATLSGTSMAAPHVSGAAALYIKNNPSAAWHQVRDGLKALAENIGLEHTDPSGLHPEPVMRADSL